MLGYFLILSAVISYGFANMMIKMQQVKYGMTAQEIMYYAFILLLPVFAILLRHFKQDLLNLPAEHRFLMMLRIACGCLMDIIVAIAFSFTSFSKATCI